MHRTRPCLSQTDRNKSVERKARPQRLGYAACLSARLAIRDIRLPYSTTDTPIAQHHVRYGI